MEEIPKSGDTRPNESQLSELLKDLVDWELVAVHLRGMTDAEIRKIKSKQQQNIDQQKLLLYSKWLSMCPDASWNDVVTALEKGNELTIAERVRNNHPFVVQPISQNTIEHEFIFPKDEEQEIIDELDQLYDSFSMLLLEVQDKIEEMVTKNEISLSTIARMIRMADLKRLKHITDCKTVDELNNSITSKCSFLDGSILHGIVKFGLPHCNKLKSRTEEHRKRASGFRKKASVKILKDKINAKITADNSQAPLIAKLNNDWDRANINNVTMLIEYLADKKDVGPKLVKVVSSSVAVTLMISEDDEACFNITTENKEQFMCLIGMFYLQVGENPPIFQEDENMNYTFENGLLDAAKTGHIQAIKFILNIGININYQNNEGKTALILASEYGHSEAVKLILSAGANVDVQGNSGETAVMVAKTVDIYQTLVQANANINIVTHKGSTPLMISCLSGNHDVANYLLFKLKHKITIRSDGGTLLMAASYGGNDTIVEYLLNSGNDPNIQDDNGRTAIQLSCFNGHHTVTEIILKHNADPNITDINGWTPMMSASQEGHHKIVKLLLQKEVDPNTVNNKNGRTALIQASQCGHNGIVELLLSKGAEPNIQDNDGITAIQFSCLYGHYTVTNTLLKHNADPATSDKNDATPTPLMCASQEGHHKIVELLLLQKGVHPNTTNSKNGRTALIQASQSGHNKTVQLLLSEGAEPNIQNIDGRTAIWLSCFNGHYTVTEILLKHNADPNIPDNNGWTPLMCASQEGHHKIVKLLLWKGVDPNTVNDKNGQTALLLASRNGHSETVKLLLLNGVEPNVQNNDGKTAIWLSCFNDHYTVTETLLEHNTNPSIPDNNGWTPLKCAIQKEHYRIVELLMVNGITDDNTMMHLEPIIYPTEIDSVTDESQTHLFYIRQDTTKSKNPLKSVTPDLIPFTTF